MEKSFHTIKKGKVQEGDCSETIGYTMGNAHGPVTCNVEDPLCYAKKILFDGVEQPFTNVDRRSFGAKNKVVGKAHYYVKMNSSDELLNPNGLYVDSQVWVFEKVDKECFDLYYRFLNTGNTSNITQAERLIRNG